MKANRNDDWRGFGQLTSRSGIIAGGNWIVDRLKFVDRYPAEEAMARIISESRGNGGSPFNLLIDLAKLGADYPLYAAGCVGADRDGGWITQYCGDNGIDTRSLLQVAEAATSYTDVFIDSEAARRTFFHYAGANAEFDIDHLDFETITARHLHLGYLLLLPCLDQPDRQFGTRAARLLALALEAGLTTSVDLVSVQTDRFAEIVNAALPFADYVFLNDFELTQASGIEVRPQGILDLRCLDEAVSLLLKRGARRWIMVHAPEGGAAYGVQGEHHWQPSLRLPPERIVSTVGAGDAFAAGVLHLSYKGGSIREALWAGVCAAAASLSAPGASEGVLSLEACLALGRRFNAADAPAIRP